MSITVSPFAAGLGAEIGGVDIGAPLGTADRAAIRAAWLDNLVLRFRGQPMDDPQHMAFTRQFGELEFNPGALIAKQYGVENYSSGRRAEVPPEISVISNIIEDGKAIRGFETVTDVSKVPGARQPMVRTHPETGKKAFFLGRRINAYVIGLKVEESEALLDLLWEHTTQEKFTWRQEWRVGDLIWWDNRCAMHRRDAFDPRSRRLMHRTQLKGTRPV